MVFTTAPPPAQVPRMMDTIIALGDPCSQDTRSDVEMRDADWEDEDQMVLDTQYRPSTVTDDGLFLRGGALYRPPDLAWLRKAAVSFREEQQSENDSDYEEGEDVRSDGGDSTSSDWDSYGDLPLVMDEYDEAVARLEGNEDWNADQRKLHKLIYMRGLHPMMPSWWRLSFKMWGITQPQLDDVFTSKNSKKRVAIHAYGNEVAATKALESLFHLSQTVTDYEEIGYQSKICTTVVKGIRGYIKWAMRDAGIDRFRTLLNMLVQGYPPDFDDDHESVGSDFAPSLASSNDEEDQENPAVAGDVKVKVKQEEAAEEASASATASRSARRFTQAVSRDLERRLLDLGQQWRDVLRDRRTRRFVAPPPTLYAFAVVQHIVLLASHDPGAATNPVVVLEQVCLNDRGQWLWNALSLALPVNLARDALNGMWESGVVVAEHEDSETDPDL